MIFFTLSLSTGNDLARVLRWGPGYTGGEDPLNYLRDVIDAEDIKLDRYGMNRSFTTFLGNQCSRKSRQGIF